MARRGISLVALVITIIVLIILTAGVIMLAGGENGIIERAQRAVEANNLATATEKVLLEVSNIKMETAGTGQTVSQYLYDTENGEARRAELEEKGISIPVTPPTGQELVFTVGDYLVTTDLKGNIQNTNALETPVGVSAIRVGDYIDYDAGTWTQEQITELQTAGLYSGAALPTSSTPYTFGGFEVGDSRNDCITPYSQYSNTVSSGWRVISKNEDGTITIAHAGTPEGYYHPYATNSAYKSEYILSEGIRRGTYAGGASQRNWDMYENVYAVEGSACLWTREEAYALSQGLQTTGAYYWIANAYNSYYLYDVGNDGHRLYSSINSCMGVRPVVTLKSNIQVAGYAGTKDENNPWQIVGLGE